MDKEITKYILKHSKSKDRELKYDFMPELLEVIERPAHRAGTIIILSIFSLLAVVIVWACVSKVDVVVMAGGNIQPIGNVKTVQSYAPGTISRIAVSEGEYVKEGEVLVELSPDTVQIDEKWLQERKDLLSAESEVYHKVIQGEDLSQLDVSSYSEESRPMVETIINTDVSYKNMLKDLEKQKESAEYEMQIAELQEKEFKENKGQEEGNGNQAEAQALLVQRLGLAVEQLDIKISDTSAQYTAQINSKLSEVVSKIEEAESQLNKSGIAKSYQKLTAPVSGYVNSLEVNTTGASVTAAQQVATIVPDNTAMEAVCYIKNMDIADIRKNMEAEIKLEAYPYTKYGTLKGKVKYISPSSFYKEKMGNVYVVKIELNNENPEIKIISGLTGSVEIKTKKRTVMDYFISPIKNGFHEALREK